MKKLWPKMLSSETHGQVASGSEGKSKRRKKSANFVGEYKARRVDRDEQM